MADAERGSSSVDSKAEIVLEVSGVPVHVGVLWPTAREARDCGRGDIRLAFDRDSGFIGNPEEVKDD